jgi:hypothetical protein
VRFEGAEPHEGVWQGLSQQALMPPVPTLAAKDRMVSACPPRVLAGYREHRPVVCRAGRCVEQPGTTQGGPVLTHTVGVCGHSWAGRSQASSQETARQARLTPPPFPVDSP